MREALGSDAPSRIETGADGLEAVAVHPADFVMAGLVGALGTSRVLSGFLFDVTPNDPTTLVLVSLTLVAVSALACLIPARRATHVDPVRVLKAD